MIRITDIIDRISTYHPQADLDLVERAYIYSARIHEGQVRLSGEPYLSHPLEVAGLLTELKLGPVSVAAGLLHDALEDTRATIEDLTQLFGTPVARIVEGVTKLSSLEFRSSEARQAESIRKMILAMADDIRVILIKLCDRLHNMRTLQFQKEKKQTKIAQETLDIYAPIANRLGIYWIKTELEDIAFMYLFPHQYREIASHVAKKREEQQEYINTIRKIIQAKMAEAHIPCEVQGRHKHFYGIYQKMMDQNVDFNEVYDILAFRIILDTVPQCYQALGIIHSIWKPIPHRFKDYIGIPKPNMYRSLHTTVIGPFGERVEIQIRTKGMDRVAKDGIAAHWQYKEKSVFDQETGAVFAWLRKLVEEQKSLKDPDEFMETVRIELFPDEVYVFTPQGDVLALPKGATPVDFAYAVHTEVGNQCTGAKVDGRMVPLKYELKTGQRVEIITSPNHHPSKDWLNFVKTAKARSRVRQHIKAEERKRSLSLGREMCDKVFRKYNVSLNKYMKSGEIEKAVHELGYKTADDLIVGVGYGKVTPLQVVRYLLPRSELKDEKETVVKRLTQRIRKRKSTSGILVKGLDDILVRFAKCCNPLPGDPVIGYITRGQGVTVHRTSCPHALNMDPERRIELEWAPDTKELYPVRIHVLCHDRMGLLANITAAISQGEANILDAKVNTRADKRADCYFTISVSGADHLENVIKSVEKIKHVIKVSRLVA
ncbi:MAG: bifunctional (p)ppGpp synthetase/guanosine-3',5'-bis(diphosphate) 3'-pyrophosphohydrolase [Deltaproteobacteria bacterium]|nr:bifunctional (p)ppGpp synthetase/guanosine-3',5'-bis(diphosphate) 3'-pyrophosphohydrolase [Deltaproteobacteria bacterium]MBW2018712.1 bifunctional (p)ppGpp synthetase/guanosine-3',5'-bis(diphosphate) 3'-pyrophosphohydrolase [Deltaproteobacteria bacterium]MBW2073441.1 bifunctional (p)ppGpp synthetase/guanosine-3',5'-bis(diphosphate) 3'-pyrophosphohydrolase [Deltaproteobacteria bacterium]RLB83048.1 MAG: GTP pyrophosphokinase [Deltaproteobacteria bacterium]